MDPIAMKDAPLKVLILSQDTDVRWLFHREIRQLGHRPVPVNNLQEVQASLDCGEYALMVVEDRKEPEDTLDLVRWARREHPDTEVILFSVVSPDPQRTFAAGGLQIAGYLIKPFRDGEPPRSLFDRAVKRYEDRLRQQPRMQLLERRMKSYSRLVDHLPMGLVLVDPQGKVLLQNRMAGKILAEADGLALDASRIIQAQHPEDNLTMVRLIATALPGLTDRKGSTGGATTIRRPSGKAPLCLMAGPLDDFQQEGDLQADEAVVALVITDPEQQLAPREKVLSRLYGFTPTQAHIAVLLMKGWSIELAAREMKISVSTARTHKKALFAKTGTSHQGELISLLWNSPAIIRLDRRRLQEEDVDEAPE